MEHCTYTRLRAAKFKNVKRLAKWVGFPCRSERDIRVLSRNLALRTAEEHRTFEKYYLTGWRY